MDRRRPPESGAGAGALTAGTASARTAEPATSRTFHHPGLLHTQADLDRMARKVAAGSQPWTDGWELLRDSPHAQADYQQRPTATVIRGGEGQNYPVLYFDVHAAYQNALVWRITGDTAHADKARDILNDWSATLVEFTGNADRFLSAPVQRRRWAESHFTVRLTSEGETMPTTRPTSTTSTR